MADDEQFSLCWNNFNTNLSAGFHESLIRGDLVDVTLAAEGQLVKAHRLILSVCSPYFRKMFTQMPANQHAFIFLKDVSHSALKDLIQFMYCGEVNVKQDALPAFISTAEALQIKGLTETGESAPPAQQSPAKDASHHLSTSAVPSTQSSPRVKPLQRTRIQSYKLDSDDGSDHEKVVQIQATSTPATVGAASSSTATLVATQVSAAPQPVQILTTAGPQSSKRTITQRASITPQTSQVMKRAKLSDPLEASEPTQIQTVQIVKQITATPQTSSVSAAASEPEYVEMPIEAINPKAEPEYADDPSEVEAIDADQDQTLAEQDTTEHDQDADDSANYVEDETYGDMSKYDETYFTEGDDAKAGASGFGSESYAESGTADQAAQEVLIIRSGSYFGGKRELIIQVEDEEEEEDDEAKDADRECHAYMHTAVHGFSFPMRTEESIERLEKAVRNNLGVKQQYIALLRKQRVLLKKPVRAFLSLFHEKALQNYNYSGRCNFSGYRKRAMKEYAIFVDCIHAAWGDCYPGEDLQMYVCRAITIINNRKRGARFRKRQKTGK